MKNRDETFGRLLKAGIASIANCEGKTAAVIEEELGQEIGVSGDTVQRYKTGFVPPEPRTIQILATAAVQRGFLGREWLQRFLHAARYPYADRLLDELCPAPQVRPRLPRVYENLPAPTYSQFVMRQQAFAEVADGLGKRTATVLIVGLGGNGKTSLAREIAACCLRDDNATPRFDAVVWVSDKDRSGTTNLSVVLDEIARTLDYPGFTEFEHEEKRREVEQLLRRQRVLLVVDNFETITDGSLLSWLLNLPEPSKALVTTREYRREWRSSWPVELQGMKRDEAHKLVLERLEILHLREALNETDIVESLIAATGGNPKAIGLTLGLVKYERRPLYHVLEDLYAAKGELFDDLFQRAWALLDEAARRILVAAPMFPLGTSDTSLGIAADVQGYARDRSIERLADLALLDVQHKDALNEVIYTLHPLVQAFARSLQREQPTFEQGARERWITFFLKQLDEVSQSGEMVALEFMEHHSQTIQAFLESLYEQQRWQLYLQLFVPVRWLLNITILRRPRVDYPRWAAEAAGALGAHQIQIRSLLQLVRFYVYNRELPQAQHILEQAEQLRKAIPFEADASYQLDKRIIIAHALVRLYTEQLEAAHHILTNFLPLAQTPADIAELNSYRALCRHKMGREEEAKQLLLSLLPQSNHELDKLTVCRACNTLTEIYLDEGNVIQASTALQRHAEAATVIRDRYQIARMRRNQSRLFILQGELRSAQDAILEAIDLFKRLGMRRELAEARQILMDLHSRATSGEDVARE